MSSEDTLPVIGSIFRVIKDHLVILHLYNRAAGQ